MHWPAPGLVGPTVATVQNHILPLPAAGINKATLYPAMHQEQDTWIEYIEEYSFVEYVQLRIVIDLQFILVGTRSIRFLRSYRQYMRINVRFNSAKYSVCLFCRVGLEAYPKFIKPKKRTSRLQNDVFPLHYSNWLYNCYQCTHAHGVFPLKVIYRRLPCVHDVYKH